MKNTTFVKLKSCYKKENYKYWVPLDKLKDKINELLNLKYRGFLSLLWLEKDYKPMLHDFFRKIAQSISTKFEEIFQIQDILLKLNTVNFNGNA
jgi:hypothetical protein